MTRKQQREDWNSTPAQHSVSRAQQTLQRILERTESAEAGKTFDQDQGECRDGESPKEQTFQLEFDCEKRESRNSSHRLLPRPNPRELIWMEQLGNGTLVSTNELKRVLSKLKNGLPSMVLQQ